MEGLVKLWGCPNTVLRRAQRLGLRLLSHRGRNCAKVTPGWALYRQSDCEGGAKHIIQVVVAAVVEQESNYRGRLATGLYFPLTFQIVARARSLKKHEENNADGSECSGLLVHVICQVSRFHSVNAAGCRPLQGKA